MLSNILKHQHVFVYTVIQNHFTIIAMHLYESLLVFIFIAWAKRLSAMLPDYKMKGVK